MFHIGPVYITPSLRIGTLGLDTNVFYTASDRRTDFTASGGPGLNIVVVPGGAVTFTVDGQVGYLYFLRTEEQRRLDGSGFAKFEGRGARTEVTVQESYRRGFARPNLEVDRRVIQTQEATRGDLRRRLFGRFTIIGGLERSATEVGEGEKFLGVDLHSTLTDHRLSGRVGLEYALTVKTSLVGEAARAIDRFPFAPHRDGRFDYLRGGLRTSSSTFISGSALGGLGWFRLKSSTGSPRSFVTADIDVTWHVSPRTRIGGTYSRGARYSAFDTDNGPTIRTDMYRGHIEKELVGRRVDVRLTGTITHQISEGAVSLLLTDGERQVIVRDDTFRMANADLGYHFRGRLRIGLMAGYSSRRSTVADLGIEGLLLGATVDFNP
jgi:hypothetical protein